MRRADPRFDRFGLLGIPSGGTGPGGAEGRLEATGRLIEEAGFRVYRADARIAAAAADPRLPENARRLRSWIMETGVTILVVAARHAPVREPGTGAPGPASAAAFMDFLGSSGLLARDGGQVRAVLGPGAGGGAARRARRP